MFCWKWSKMPNSKITHSKIKKTNFQIQKKIKFQNPKSINRRSWLACGWQGDGANENKNRHKSRPKRESPPLAHQARASDFSGCGWPDWYYLHSFLYRSYWHTGIVQYLIFSSGRPLPRPNDHHGIPPARHVKIVYPQMMQWVSVLGMLFIAFFPLTLPAAVYGQWSVWSRPAWKTPWRTWRELDVWNSVARNHSADHVAHPQEAPLWGWVAQTGCLHLPQHRQREDIVLVGCAGPALPRRTEENRDLPKQAVAWNFHK